MAKGNGKDPDLLRVYIKQATRAPLLTREQEYEYAAAINLGKSVVDPLRELYVERESAEQKVLALWNRYEDIYARSFVNWQNEVERINKVITAYEHIKQVGEEGFNSLVLSNTRLVVHMARKRLGGGLPFLDLINEGNIGLITGVERFDYTKGYRASSYITWWIRQSMERALKDQPRTVRVPVNKHDDISKVKRATRTLEQRLKRAPHPEEIADFLDMSPVEVRLAIVSEQAIGSIHEPNGNKDERELVDLLPDNNAESPDELVQRNEEAEYARALLDALSSRDADIMRRIFGLGLLPETYEEIGARHKISRQRVEQILRKSKIAMKKRASSLTAFPEVYS